VSGPCFRRPFEWGLPVRSTGGGDARVCVEPQSVVGRFTARWEAGREAEWSPMALNGAPGPEVDGVGQQAETWFHRLKPFGVTVPPRFVEGLWCRTTS